MRTLMTAALIAAFFVSGCSTPDASSGPSAAGAVAADQEAPPCYGRGGLARMLSERHDERPVGVGVTPGGIFAEIWSSPAGSWTFILTRPRVDGDAVSCVMAVGDGWQAVLPAPAGVAS